MLLPLHWLPEFIPYLYHLIQEPFIDAVVQFLKRRCPPLLGFKEELSHQQMKGQLSPETVGTILAILQNYTA